MPGSGGKEDEINIGMEVVVDPHGPNPMTTYVEAQVKTLKLLSGNTDTVYTVQLQVAEDEMGAEAEAETKAKGEAEVKAGIQRSGNKVSLPTTPILLILASCRTATQCSWT